MRLAPVKAILRIILLTISGYMICCASKVNLNEQIKGTWKLDSTEIYEQGVKEIRTSKNEFWNFNEYDDVILFDRDSIKQVFHFKIKDGGIYCYDSKTDTSDWTFQLRIVSANKSGLVLQDPFDGKSATKFFMSKIKDPLVESIISKRYNSDTVK